MGCECANIHTIVLRVRNVIEIAHIFATRTVLFWQKGASNSHFVQICIRGK
jgi:hypothetical protein